MGYVHLGQTLSKGLLPGFSRRFPRTETQRWFIKKWWNRPSVFPSGFKGISCIFVFIVGWCNLKGKFRIFIWLTKNHVLTDEKMTIRFWKTTSLSICHCQCSQTFHKSESGCIICQIIWWALAAEFASGMPVAHPLGSLAVQRFATDLGDRVIMVELHAVYSFTWKNRVCYIIMLVYWNHQ